MRASSSLKRISAKVLPSSVLPTPVGPKNKNVPIGLLGSLSPERDKRIAFAIFVTASSCPITRLCITCSIPINFLDSSSIRRFTGIPVHLATIHPMSSSSISSLSRRFLPD